MREDVAELLKRLEDTQKGETICLNHEECQDLMKMIEDQDERIAIMTEGGWISVGERLPEDEYDVLLYGEGKGIVIAYYSEGTWYDHQHNHLRGMTHWMPLPEPLKEGEA